MNAMRALLSTAALFIPSLVALSALLHGQGPFYGSPIPPGPCTAIVAGDLDGNLSPEVAVIQSNKLIVFQNPDVSGAAFEVTSDVLDVCYWPTASGEGAPGLLYTTTGGDLGMAIFIDDELSGPYICGPVCYQLGATRIRYAVDQGQEKLFFVGSDSKSFYSAVIAGGAISAPDYLFTIGPTVLDFLLLDYLNTGGDTGLDIGILHTNGVNIRTQGNVIYIARAGLQPGDAIAAVRHPSSAQMKDSLAWITRLTGGVPHLFLFNPLFGTPEHPSPYLSIPVNDASAFYASAAAADVDGDGTEDVVMGRTDSWIDIQKLGNPASQPLFGELVPPVSMSTTGSPTPMAKIICAELFNETNPDDVPVPAFAAMLPEKNGLRLEHALPPPPPPPPDPDDPPQIPPSQVPDFDAVTYESAMHQTYSVETGCATSAPATDAPRAKWTIDLGHGWGLTSANYVELIVRRCPGTATVAETHALAHLIFPIDTTEADDSPTDDDTDGIGFHNTQITFHAGLGENASTNWTIEDLASRYFAMVRPIRLASPPNFASMNRAWSWEILGMSANCDASDWLQGRPGAGTPINIETEVCSTIFCHLDNRLPPKAVPQSNIPESGANVLPVVYDPPYNN